MSDDTASSPDLNTIQKWLQSVVTHPNGVAAGVESDAAQQHVALTRDQLEQLVTRTSNRSAEERLNVYAHAYYARLIDCLGEVFPMLKRALGEEVFNSFASDYLQEYPSRSYTLNEMGRHFAQFFQETRPDRDEHASADNDLPVNWPDLLIDLANLEWTINEVFDGPGIEGQPTLTHNDLAAVAPRDWPNIRLQPIVCLRLLATRYPVNDYYTALRQADENDDIDKPAPAPSWVAIARRDYVVRRFSLSRPQYALLTALQDGATVGQAIEHAAEHADHLDDSAFAEALQEWFKSWTAEELFAPIENA